jgi:hypothetical protein
MLLDRKFPQVIDGLGEKLTDRRSRGESFHGNGLLTV